MTTQAEILSALREIARIKPKIRLLSVYKGVPLAYEATILAVGVKSIQVETNLYQFVSLYRDRNTFLQTPRLPMVLATKASHLDVHQLLVELSQFEPAPSGIGERKQVRVCPEEVLKSRIYTPGMGASFQAELADLSLDGLAIYIPQPNFYPTVYRKGVKVRVTLRLPGKFEVGRRPVTGSLTSSSDPMERFSREALRTSHAPGTRPLHLDAHPSKRLQAYPEITIQGSIANVVEDSTHARFRLGIQILPGDPARAMVKRFISQRQAEIIRELQMMYNLIREQETS